MHRECAVKRMVILAAVGTRTSLWLGVARIDAPRRKTLELAQQKRSADGWSCCSSPRRVKRKASAECRGRGQATMGNGTYTHRAKEAERKITPLKAAARTDLCFVCC